MAKKPTQDAPQQATVTLTKEQRIEAERARLMPLFNGADENKLDFIREQVKQLAFFNVSIAELQEKINRFGTLVQYDNGGGQSGIKVNPDIKTLTEYQKLCNAVVKVLMPVIPLKMAQSKLTEFLDLDLEDV